MKKEKQKLQIFENTDIISVEISGKKVVVTFATLEGDALTNHKMEYDATHKAIHPDFKKAMDSMKQYLAKVFYIDDLEDRLSVNKLDFQFKDNVESVRINGKLLLASDNMTPIKTDFIRVREDNKVYDFKNDIEVDANIVRVEAFKYCFEDKKAQLSMDFGDESDNKEEIADIQEVKPIQIEDKVDETPDEPDNNISGEF